MWKAKTSIFYFIYVFSCIFIKKPDPVTLAMSILLLVFFFIKKNR